VHKFNNEKKNINFFNYTVLVTTAIFLLTPIVVYLIIGEIRKTFSGKVCIVLLISQIYMMFVMPTMRMTGAHPWALIFIALVFYTFGAFLSNFVVNFMCFDIYLTLKNFSTPHHRSTYFKRFFGFVLVLFVIALILPFAFNGRRALSFGSIFFSMVLVSSAVFVLTVLMNIFALVSALYYLAALTRSNAENTRLDVERER
jgi:hypothetical protein